MSTASFPIWAQILIAILVTLAAFGGLAGGIYAARSARRAAREARAEQTAADDHERAEVWNSGYRAAAEKHLEWDALIVALLRGAYDEINKLHDLLDLDEVPMPKIPDKPPLFPEFSGR